MRVLKLDHETLRETGESYGDYDSLAWNEKYQEYGDFQLRSYDLEGALDFFDTETFISIPGTHVVMRVERVEIELSDSGTQSVSVTGKGVEAIFEYRPALQSIAATTNPDREFDPAGDPLETNSDYYPRAEYVSALLYASVAQATYGSSRKFGHLRLPFYNLLFSLDGKNDQIVGDRLPSYEAGDSVWDTLTDHMEIGQFHITVARPGSEYHGHITDRWVDRFVEMSSLKNSDPLPSWLDEDTLSVMAMVFEIGGDMQSESDLFRMTDTPVILARSPKVAKNLQGHDLTLSAIRDDYLSAKQGSSAEHPNIVYKSHEDGVMETWVGEKKPSGLLARVGYEEVSIADLPEYDFRKEETVHFLMPFAQSLLDGKAFSLSTDGVFPMDPKAYDPIHRDGSYYLGDLVTIEFPWGDTVKVQVTEYVRTYDSSGAMEYPTFTPILYTHRDLSVPLTDNTPIQTTNQKIREEMVELIKQGHYSEELLEAFKNYKMHPDWL